MNTTEITGASGEVRWGYYSAASLGPWSLSVTAHGGTVSASVVSSDAYRLEQPDLRFVVPIRNGAATWTWPILSLSVAGSTLTASLGPQEG